VSAFSSELLLVLTSLSFLRVPVIDLIDVFSFFSFLPLTSWVGMLQKVRL
jgi:hypothetical protein